MRRGSGALAGRSGGRSRPHPAELSAGAPQAQIPRKRGATCGEPCRTRTYNLEIKSLLLYQLS